MGAARFFSSLAVALLLAAPAAAQAPAPAQAPAAGGAPANPPVTMTISSTAFADGDPIPVEFSQAAEGVAPGEGKSPPLAWTSPPEGTQSYVMHMHDLEFARNRTVEDQLHWLVWNIPATTTRIPEGVARGEQLPDGSSQISATGPVYRGPGARADGAPHHYVFELLALDVPSVEVEPSDDPFETRRRVMEAVQGHVLGKAILVGVFRRPG